MPLATFGYYELGNELDNKCLVAGSDGSLVGHYDQTKIKRIGAYLKGLHEGIKFYDNTPKTILDFAGWHHYGFFAALNLWFPSINTGNPCNNTKFDYFDIMGLHFYSSYSNLVSGTSPSNGDLDKMLSVDNSTPNISMLKKLDEIYPNKNIWITEINTESLLNYSIDSPEAKKYRIDWLRKNMDIANNFKGNNGTYKVKAFFFYELYDQILMEGVHKNFGMFTCSNKSCDVTTVKQDLLDGLKSKMTDIDANSVSYIPYVQSLYMSTSCTSLSATDPN